MDEEVIGREEELEALTEFLADPGGTPDLVVLDGPPGIGKTTLWKAANHMAHEGRYRVLACEPIEVESRLAFVGLRDLLEGTLEEALSGLAGPQRRALDVALLDRNLGREPIDERAMSFGLLNLLRALAETTPLLLAIDDIQWLDPASFRAITFAMRRLARAPVKLVCTQRNDAELDLFGRSMPEQRVRRTLVGGLSLLTVQRLLRQKLGRTFPHWLLERIHEVSAGNPFFALQLGQAVRDSGEPQIGTQLPLPDTLAKAVRDQLGQLPELDRDVLGLVAALSRPTVTTVQDGWGDPVTAKTALRRAAALGILHIDEDRVRFSHPIVRQVTIASLPVGRARDLHLRAADIVSSAEERASHLALSTDEPNEAIAEEVSEAAMRVRARGAPRSAAELAELASALSVDEDGGVLRQLAAADFRQVSGDTLRAKELVEDLVTRLPAGPLRAEALYRLANLNPDMAAGIELCHQALSEAGDGPGRKGRIHLSLGRLLGMTGEGERWEQNLELALAFADEADDATTFVGASQELAIVRLLAGCGPQRGLLERAQARAEEIDSLPGGEQPRLWLGMELVFDDALGEARTLMEAVLDETAGRGHLESDAAILVLLTDLELRAGNWPEAAEYASRATALAEEGDLGGDTEAAALFARAAVDAHLGRVEQARDTATRGSQLAANTNDWMWWAQNERVLGFLAWSLDDALGAWEHLGPLVDRLRDMRIRTPTVIPVLSCAVEALIGLGEPEPAASLVTEAERHGARVGSSWTEATVARCRALLAADGQEGFEVALQLGSEAVARQLELPYPFELGRSYLALGVIQRRAKQRRAARESLQQAADIFGKLGSTLWEQKAHRELGRIAGRAPGSHQLTPTEWRVAELVAVGRTNREVAAVLYVSVRSVEANLTRIYDKLGIRSRTQLVHHLMSREETHVEP